MLRMDFSNSAVSLGQFFLFARGVKLGSPFVFPELHTQTLRYSASGKDVKDSRFPG